MEPDVLMEPTVLVEPETLRKPRVSRPHMPGYGIAGPEQGAGLLPWAWAEKRLTNSRNYWLATVHPDGRPHVMPVWGVWDGSAIWFSAAPRSRKVRNLIANPMAVMTTENADEPVVVEGSATRVGCGIDDQAFVVTFTSQVNAKYGTDFPAEFFIANATFQLRPSVAFGLVQADFTGSPTRWEFG